MTVCYRLEAGQVGYREGRFLSETHSGRTRGNGHEMQQGKFLLDKEK